MANQKLVVASPDPIADAHEVIDLCAKTFGNYFKFRQQLRDWYLLNSSYDWKVSAIGRMDGQIVTHYGVWGYKMRIGRSVVRCGGIGCVATDGEHRKAGLMSRTIPHSNEAMKQCGYDLSMLFGIWDYYHRFGYVRGWSETTFHMTRDQMPKDLPKVAFKELPAAPREDIAQLHNRHNARVTGSAVRPVFQKGYCFFQGKPECYGWSKGKQLVGHVLVQANGNRLVCFEATGQTQEILSVINALAISKGTKEISFETLPFTSPLATSLRRATVKIERQYIKSGGAMVRVINLQSCLRKMLPELSARLSTSDLAGYRGEVAFAGAEQTVGLTVNKGKVTLSDKPSGRNVLKVGHHAGQLLIGTDEPEEICEACGVRLSGDTRRLVAALFPNQHPQLHQADRY